MERGHRDISPFDTYDLLFVKDLVNNLNKDNEVLNGSLEDLKHAFMFLFDKHKILKRNYVKECLNRSVIDNQKLRIEDL
jgi:hypothetical protein